MNFTKKYFVPVLETIIDVQGDSLEYSEPLNVIEMCIRDSIKQQMEKHLVAGFKIKN